MKGKYFTSLLLLLFFPFLLSAHGKRELVWVLDAGHGGKDVGCEGAKFREKDITLSITKEVARLLRLNKPGIRVLLTRDKDEYITLDERCQKANRANADLFLSIHVNYAPNNLLLQGTETFYASTRKGDDAVLQAARMRNSDKSELLAWLLQKSYYDAGRVADRGAKTEHLYVVMNTMMPAALTEVGFMSNIEEQAYVRSDRGQKEIAACIYDALIEYYTTTQAKTHTQTLATLRRTNGTSSGLSCPKIAPRSTEKNLALRALDSDGNDLIPSPYKPEFSGDPDDLIPPPLIPETFEEGELERAGMAPVQVAVQENAVVQESEAVSAVAETPVVPVPSGNGEDLIPPPLIPETFSESEQKQVVPKASENSVVQESLVVPETPVVQENPVMPVAQENKVIPLVPEKVDGQVVPLVPAPKEEVVESPAVEKVVEDKKQVEKETSPTETVSQAKPVFSIQIVSVSSELRSTDPRLKGLSPVTFVKSGNMFKGLYGGTTDYRQAKATLDKVRKTFPDAFIVAYLGEKSISTAEAISMSLSH